MRSKELEKLIDHTKYQVFLLSCSAPLPMSFAVHSWFVVNQKGVISRWEVIHKKNLRKTSWGYLYMNIRPIFQGSLVFLTFHKYFWKNFKLLGYMEGDENSTAEKITEFILNSKDTYPYRDKYFVSGPNSNTYPQWVLNAFPEFKAKLPWNAFGKNIIKQ